MMMTTISNTDKATFDALISLVRAIRPTWNESGCRAAVKATIAAHPSASLAALTIAFVTIAGDDKIRTPAVLPMDGDHWRDTGYSSSHSSTREQAPACDHGVQHGTWNGDGRHGPDWRLCPLCRPARSTPAATEATEELAQPQGDALHAALERTKAGLCSHGVQLDHCTRCREGDATDASAETTTTPSAATATETPNTTDQDTTTEVAP